MNTNAVADNILDYLSEKYPRVYRNRAKVGTEFPYIVFRLDSALDSYPSEDYYLNIDIYEKSGMSVRTIEALADVVDKGLNHTVRINASINLQFEREQRQFVPSDELVTEQLINLRYTVRAYEK